MPIWISASMLSRRCLRRGDRVFAYNFNDNLIPGMKSEERGYWKDVGTIDSYYEANMDLIDVSPQLNLYNYKWPILTNQGNLPPAKTVFDDEDRRGHEHRLLCLRRLHHQRRHGSPLHHRARMQGQQLQPGRGLDPL